MEPQPLSIAPGFDRAFFRELWRPWKLATFGLGMAWLLYGATHYHIGDWDVGLSLIMGSLTYLFAPWSVRLIALSLRQRPPRWLLLFIALLPAWASIDGSYVIYNTLTKHPMLRYENFCASSALYFLAGMIWLYRGSLRELWGELRVLARQ